MPHWLAEQVFSGGRTLRLMRGDLTEERVDAIVNAANTYLAHGGGVAGAIARKGGPQIELESDAWVREKGPVSHETPAVTGGGRLPCRFVIHAVGPVWGSGDEDTKLKAAVQGALAIAQELELARVAMPAISTGIFGFPKERAAEVIVGAIAEFFANRVPGPLQEVRLVLIDEPCVQAFVREFARRWRGSVPPQ